MSALDTTAPPQRRMSAGAAVGTVACVLAMAAALTWTFLSMRAVMAVGGTCASGGPYVTATPCPSGAGLIAVAIPVLVVSAMAGSAFALAVHAPNLLVPMWAGLFGFLGFNFLDGAFAAPGLDVGWLACGVMFELMALPAVVFLWIGIRDSLSPAPGTTTHVATRWWFAAYVVLGWAGIALGWWSYHALS